MVNWLIPQTGWPASQMFCQVSKIMIHKPDPERMFCKLDNPPSRMVHPACEIICQKGAIQAFDIIYTVLLFYKPDVFISQMILQNIVWLTGSPLYMMANQLMLALNHHYMIALCHHIMVKKHRYTVIPIQQ